VVGWEDTSTWLYLLKVYKTAIIIIIIIIIIIMITFAAMLLRQMSATQQRVVVLHDSTGCLLIHIDVVVVVCRVVELDVPCT